MHSQFTSKSLTEFYRDFDLSPLPTEVIDRSGLPVSLNKDKWLINEATFPITLHFDKINILNPFINYAIKRYLIQRIKQISPRETNNCWSSLKLLATTENWKQLQVADSLELTETLLPIVLSELLEKLRRKKTEDRFHRLRAWYIWCTEQELPGFNSEVMYDLLKIKVPGNEKGRAVMLDDAEQAPPDRC